MSRGPDSYERGCNIMLALIRDWIGEPPRFRLGPKGVVVVADLGDHRLRACLNDGATQLLELMIKRCRERTGNAPTALMLEVVLDVAGVPYERGTLEQLGLPAGLDAHVNARRPH